MERDCFVGCAESLSKLGAAPDTVLKRFLKHHKLQSENLVHIVFLDFSKLGRVSQLQVNEAVTYCKRALESNATRSVAFIVPPLLASASVLNGLKGEQRRLEDKCDDLEIATRTINLSLDQRRLHGNVDIPCNFPALLGVLDSTLPAKGLQHRARVEQDTVFAAKGNQNMRGPRFKHNKLHARTTVGGSCFNFALHAHVGSGSVRRTCGRSVAC